MNIKRVDVRDFACPMPIIKTSIALRNARAGEVFVVVANDGVFENDIAAWCEKTNNTLKSLDVTGNEIVATIVKN